MGIKISNLLVLVFVFFFGCFFARELTLEDAVQHAPVLAIQQLIADGQIPTARVCELASKRMAVAHYLFSYLEDQITQEYRGYKIPFSRQELYTCLSALMVHADDVHFVRKLLLFGAHAEYHDVIGNTAYFNTAYFYAVQQDRPDKARVLAHEDSQIYAQLLQQVQQKKLDELWLEKNFHGLNRLNINRPYAELSWQPVIIQAVANNDYETTRLLLVSGATHQQAALKIALRGGSKQLIQLLMRHGACVSALDDALSLVTGYNPQAHEIIPWLSSFYGKRMHDRLSTATKKALCPIDLKVTHEKR